MYLHPIIRQRQFRYLSAFYLHSTVHLFAISIFGIFTSLFIMHSFQKLGMGNAQALGITSLFFCLIFTVQAVSIAPALWLISRKGLRFSVFLGNIFLIAFFMILYLGQFEPIFFFLAAILSGLQIGMYWTAYHIYFAELTDDHKQGEEIGIGMSLSAIASIGGPAFGGLIINYSGFGLMFLIITILIIIANLPLRYLPKQKDLIKIDIMKTVRLLSPKKEFHSYLSLFGIGIVDVANAIFWPLFTFSILSGFVGIGFMGSLMALVATISTVIMGFLIDRFGTKRIRDYFSVLDSIVWTLKTLVALPWQVFGLSAAQSFTTSGAVIATDCSIYERSRHEDVAAFIVQREVGLAVGRALFLLLMGILFWFGVPLVATFIFAAIASLLIRFYPEKPVQPVQ